MNADFKRITDAGAEFVGGTAYIDHKEVGHWTDGEFYAEPGTEDLVKSAGARKREREATIKQQAEDADRARKSVPAVGTTSKVEVPETPKAISTADAATAMNSIPGDGPRNPVRIDGDNNASKPQEPTSTEDLLRELGNLDGAAAVKDGAKQAQGTGTELASTKGAGRAAATNPVK